MSSKEGTEKVERRPSRSGPARAVRAGTCELLTPKNDPGEKNPVEANVVRVEEIRREEDPIQWVLLTTEPASTFKSDFKKALRIVDYYQARWRIEESRKALKTGW